MSTAAMTTATDSPSAQAKKPYARPMTEKRKEQNRRSQKLYRERLKKKLEELEEKVQDKTQLKQSPSPLEAVVRGIPEHFSESAIPNIVSKNKNYIIDLNAAFTAGGDLSLPNDHTLPTFELGFRDHGWQSVSPSSTPSMADSVTADESSIPKYLAAGLYAPVDPDSADMRLMWPVPIHFWTESYTPPTANEQRVVRPHSSLSSARITPSLTRSPYSRITSGISTPSGIPSPYLNHLRLLGETAFAATLAIAATLGITRSSYINDHPSPLGPFGEHAPIYNYKAIPKDLRPTREQTTLCHPSYLDCIVFPKFRSAAIALSARGELDHCSLFLDIMHDGLICWGNECASASTGRDMRDGVAWSKRSWEARPWFLRKWAWLLAIDPTIEGIGLARGDGVVVDEDEHDIDGMFEGSRWWRMMRGEEFDENITQKQNQESESPAVEEHGEMLSRNATCNFGVRDVEEFSGNGMLWPTQFRNPMADKLGSVGLSAPYGIDLDLGRKNESRQHQQDLKNDTGGFGFSLY